MSELLAMLTSLFSDQFVLSGASSSVSLNSFTTTIGTPVGKVCANFSIVSLISNEVLKMFLEIMRRKNKHLKIAFSNLSKLNSIEKTVSKSLTLKFVMMCLPQQLMKNKFVSGIKKEGDQKRIS